MRTLLELTTAPLVIFHEGSGFQPPTLEHEFFPEPFLFAGTPFEMNRIIMVRLIATVILALILIIYARRAKLIPGRGQAAVESLLDFSRVNIGHEILGEEQARKYQPFLMTLFLGILFMNLTSIIPGLQIAGTSLVGMPLIFAAAAYLMMIGSGMKARGGLRFFREQLFPPGVPWPLYIILTPIEFISTFVIRPATHTIRLLANMMAGHFVLVVIFVGTHFLYREIAGASGIALGSLTLLGGVVYVAFELFISALQAYIFAMLAAAYISLSISEH